VTSARLRAAALVLGLVLGLVACSGRQGPARTEHAVVVVHSELADAALWLDGRYIGPLGSLRGGVAVAPGPHRVEVRHDEYFSYYAEIELGPRERRTIEVQLAPILP
jgi:hypothetical protein